MRHRSWICGCLLAVAASLPACSRLLPPDPPPSSRATGLENSDRGSVSASPDGAFADSITVRLDVPDTVHTGEPISFRIVVGNLATLYTSGVVKLPARIGMGFDVVVTQPDRMEVWNWRGGAPPMADTLAPLPPADTMRFDVTWDQKDEEFGLLFLPPGVYCAYGIVYGVTDHGGPLVSAPEQLVILPREVPAPAYLQDLAEIVCSPYHFEPPWDWGIHHRARRSNSKNPALEAASAADFDRFLIRNRIAATERHLLL